MKKYLLSLLLVFSIAHHSFAEGSDVKVEEWFKESAIREAVYIEFVVAPYLRQQRVIATWGDTAEIRKSETFSAAHSSLFSDLIKDCDEIENAWGLATREILKMPNLTKAEAETILGFINLNRKTSRKQHSEILTYRNSKLP